MSERKLEVIQDHGEWKYRFRPIGYKWGHFMSEAEAKRAGEEHIARAIRFDNDYGIPQDQLNGMPAKKEVNVKV